MTAARAARAPLSLVALLLLLLLGACAGNETPAGGPSYPALTGRVVDNADLLPPADEAALTQRLEALQRATSRQLVVATVPDMGGYQIEEYANGLLRHWRLGQRGADNGVLLLVARTERKIRIETGYQMEAIVTDALASRIIREQMQPRFRADDYPGGINAGANALITQLQAPPEAAEQAAVQAQQAENRRKDAQRDSGGGDSSGGFPFALLFWIGVTLFIVFGLVGSGMRGRRYRTRKGGWGPVVIWDDDDWSGRRSRSRGRRSRGWDDWGGWGGGGWGGWSGGSSGGSGGGWGGGSWGGGGSGGGFSGGGGSGGGGGASGGW